jgi:signal transduction histidine kinase
MTIRSKITCLFIAIALVPYTAIALFIYTDVRIAVENTEINHLSTLATIQKIRTVEVVSKYTAQFKQFSSRLLLRKDLLQYENTHDLKSYTSIQESIDGAKSQVSDIQDITLLASDGHVIVSTNTKLKGKDLSKEEFFQKQLTSSSTPTFVKQNGVVYLYLAGPIFLGSKQIGVLAFLLKTDDLYNLFSDFSGLGATGSWGLAQKQPNGDALFIVPGRFDTDPAHRLNSTVKNVPENSSRPIMRALAGEEKTFPDLVNYQGKHVIAATRYIPELGWGIGVTQDRSEALTIATTLGTQLMFFSALLILFVGFLSSLISQIITKPIRNLSAVASRVANGDLSVSALIQTKDEIGSLGGVFNMMILRLRQTHEELEQKVFERTKDLEEAKAKDDAVLSSINEGIVVVNVTGKPTFSNATAREILGLDVGDMSRTKKAMHYGIFNKDAITPIPATELPSERALHGEVVTGEIYFIRNAINKKGAYIRASAAPIIANSVIIGAVCTYIDITKDQEVDRAKTEFVSIASHQLRTPTTSIRWYAEMLLEDAEVGPLNVLQRQYLEEIYSSDKRMIDLVNSLLNVSRIELGTFSMQIRPTNIESIIENVISENSEQLQHKKIIVVKNITARKDFESDPDMLRVVIQNLINNAIEYTPHNGQITCALEETLNGLTCTISDTGCGIPLHMQNKIFTKFFRADNAREIKPEGNGLGLYITKSIIEAFNGTISFVSDGENGTAFTFMLPYPPKSKIVTKKPSQKKKK